MGGGGGGEWAAGPGTWVGRYGDRRLSFVLLTTIALAATDGLAGFASVVALLGTQGGSRRGAVGLLLVRGGLGCLVGWPPRPGCWAGTAWGCWAGWLEGVGETAWGWAGEGGQERIEARAQEARCARTT
ncbi:hypothetical protein [Streptomyces sp. CA-253872]|uniref:hypothetical protein n=1 Tax=Streptomyces sp. CA-253872 TaxID=3240067 RepID=UPI003D94FB92